MSRVNFYVSTDSDGKMPVLADKPLKESWVQYRNDTPVRIKPYVGQDRVWDYSTSSMIALKPEAKCYSGKPMKMYAGVIISEQNHASNSHVL